MNTDDLRALAERADSIEGRAATRLGEVQERIRTARRRRAVGAGAGAAAAVLAVVLGATLLNGNEPRSEDPVTPSPNPSTPSPNPSKTFQIPRGQTTIEADIEPGEVRGWKVLATVTNTQPEHLGATDLAATATVHTDPTYYDIYCHSADPSVFLFFSFTDGGGAHGRCDEGSPSLPPPDIPVRSLVEDAGTHSTFRMFVARLSPEAQACYLKPADDCLERYGQPQPLAATDAEFGFRIFDLPTAPVVLELFKEPNDVEAPYWFKALTTINGVAWLIDRAIVAGADDGRIAFELPASPGEYLVDVYTVDTPHLQRCVEQHADVLPEFDPWRPHSPAIDRICGTKIRLVVDGTTVLPEKGPDPSNTGHFSDLGAQLSAGDVHQVSVEVVHGDPRNIRFAAVVHVRTELP